MSGQLECLIGLISSGAPLVQTGKLRGIVVTGSKRSSVLPQVPTVADAGYPGFEASGWLGLMFPAKTPPAIIDRMYRETVAVMNMAEVREQLQNVGIDPAPSNPETFRAYMRAELAKWTKLIREAGLKLE
jgi:tripartite-type tricarboxylate transporter receptor subunit TctC